MINIQFGTSRNRQSLVRMVLFNGSNILIFVTYNYPNHPKSIPKASQKHPQIIPKSSQNHPNFTISPVYTTYIPCLWLAVPYNYPDYPKMIPILQYHQFIPFSDHYIIHIYIYIIWIYQETWGFLTDLFGFLINL